MTEVAFQIGIKRWIVKLVGIHQMGTYLVARNPVISDFTKYKGFFSYIVRNPRVYSPGLKWQLHVIKDSGSFYLSTPIFGGWLSSLSQECCFTSRYYIWVPNRKKGEGYEAKWNMLVKIAHI